LLQNSIAIILSVINKVVASDNIPRASSCSKNPSSFKFLEVWTNNFKSSPAEEDDVEEDGVEMTGEGGDSGEPSRVDEDPFEKELRLTNEASEEQARA
jgi:hypothetical protein